MEQLEAAVEAILARRPQATPAELAAAAAATANPQPPAAVAAVDINAITHTIPNFRPEDVDGFFATFEAACLNKNITSASQVWWLLNKARTTWSAAKTRERFYLAKSKNVKV